MIFYLLPILYLLILIFNKKSDKSIIYFLSIWIMLPPIIFHALEFRVYFLLSFLSLIYFIRISNLISSNSNDIFNLTNIFLSISISILHYWGALFIISIGLSIIIFNYKLFSLRKLIIFHLIPLSFHYTYYL